ncbi:MAG: transglutaminase domain-containing protein [Candidatus Omnitrophota bacterium]|jgi:transglutaminase-like putative cysteine protease
MILKIILNVTGLLSIFLLINPAFAEAIQLKSGKIVEGKIIEKTKEYIKLDVEGVTLTYYSDQIAKDNLEDPSSQNSSPQTLPQKENFLKYRITQKFYVKAIDDTNFLKFSMVIPRNDLVREEISDVQIFPNPNTTFKDSDANEIVVYYNSLLKAGTSFIAGFNYNLKIDAKPLGVNPESIPDAYTLLDSSIKNYLLKEGEVDPDQVSIKEQAQSLTANITNPYFKAKAIYAFITDNFTYDMELLNQIKSNPNAYHSYSPPDTLILKKGICYDFAKLFVALSRSSGVPARVVRGLAFDLKENENRYVENLGHAWAEIFLPIYGWVPVDPTFGLSSKDKYFCFNYKGHIPQEYGLSEVKEFGSLEKGWHLQFRSQTKPARPPVEVVMQAELITSE